MKRQEMKRNRIFRLTGLIALAALVLMAGCASGDELGVADAGSNSLVPLRIGKATLERESSTRAVAAAAVPAGSVIGVFRREDADYTRVSNEPYMLNGTEWEPVNPDMAIGLRNAVSHLGAFYPFGVLPAKGITVTLTARLWEAGKEAFYAPFTASSLSPQANFTMKHVYSRVCILFKRNADNYPNGAGQITALSLLGTGIYTHALLDVTKELTDSPFSGYETPGYSLTGITRTATLKGIANAADGSDCIDLLMVPNVLSGKITFTATIDGKEMLLVLDASKLGGSLDAGKRYNITVTIRGTALWVNSLTFAGWDETPIANVIDSEFE